ncbi:hypothetical protein [Brumicola pallidula]|jgi:outer membrane murein-binding lipoprotein Lpp|uniref:Uncharacterized protein n=1 Tax=Brumicola pallidula DSM 14239 = ACAM 615 TaxID=1121922 RepID=K6YVV3_9ALTE|nr:hypothetical protein [Glaciecola pallidula]GAC28146.1 hypothetical protein GPAL_1273 [Glaciecola pallidula DSM 14239 = ACAM 615]
MNLVTKIILTACILCITFVAGYLAGSNAKLTSILSFAKTENAQTAKQLNSELNTLTVAPTTNPPVDHQNSALDTTNVAKTRALNNTAIILDSGDIIALFNDFVTYSTSNSDYKEYGKKIDDIRKILVSSNSELALLLEYFDQVPIDSQASYMFVSIIMGLPQELSKPAMQRVMENTLVNTDPANLTNFLELVARTGIKSPSITSSLKDIAIFSGKDDEALSALDMLMPYELSHTENQQVTDRLKAAIDSSESADSPYYFSQLLRFSSSTQREQLALDTFNATDANTSMQSIIMDSIQAGTLDRSPALKEALFNIAKQDQNQLQQQALYTLLYRFDLSHDEYNDISRDKNLNIENSRF